MKTRTAACACLLGTRAATGDACKGMDEQTQMKLRADVAMEQYEEDSRQGLVGARP
ncbi:hypothetical protein [Streptomyces echinatus]|uniref:hypothetical protein n=1 Tax=Streptomyces echinatus TaxID=67293 RepID=UPI00382E23D6